MNPSAAALLLTDLVGSAALAQHLGDDTMGRVWAAHDRVARDLLRDWQGREIDKTAREQLAAGREILCDLQDQLSLGLLLCRQTESQALAGELAAAQTTAAEAQALAQQAGAGPESESESELGLALTSLTSYL